MIKLKDNIKNKYKGVLVNCDACDMRVPESQTHVMLCAGYEQLIVGKEMATDVEKKLLETCRKEPM